MTLFTLSHDILTILLASISIPKNSTCNWSYTHFSGLTNRLLFWRIWRTSFVTFLCSFFVFVKIKISSMYTIITFRVMRSLNKLFIIVWNTGGEFWSLKNIMFGSKLPRWVIKAAFHQSSSLIWRLLYLQCRSSFVKYLASWNQSIRSNIRRIG